MIEDRNSCANVLGRLMNEIAMSIHLLDDAAEEVTSEIPKSKMSRAKERLEIALADAEKSIFGDFARAVKRRAGND